MRVLVSGAGGFVGRAVVAALEGRNDEVWRLVRREPRAGASEIRWDPDTRLIDATSLDGFDAVVHLAGESPQGRWSEAKKRRILESRVHGTELISRAVAGKARRPRVLVSASAVGFYGDRGDDVLTEADDHGEGFLAGVCIVWEGATRPAAQAGIRVVNARFGLVLHPEGGALEQMRTPFELGLGGRQGRGTQWWAWIHRHDAARSVLHLLDTETLSGPVNVVAPEPVRNRDFARILARQLGRPALVRAPRFALHALLGGMADEMLFASQRVVPRKLLDSGFRFEHPTLDEALRDLLG